MFGKFLVSIIHPINALIVILGVFVFLALMGKNRSLKDIIGKVSDAYRETKTKTRINSETLAIVSSQEQNLDVNIMDDLVEEFNAIGSEYLTWVQLISIFPLLGLLGTIIGLIPGLEAVAQQNLEPLYSSLNTALFSTFWGLLVAIVLKIYVAFGPSKCISDIENKFAENDRKFNLMATFHRVNE